MYLKAGSVFIDPAFYYSFYFFQHFKKKKISDANLLSKNTVDMFFSIIIHKA
jgi:hypothetical protein